MLRSRLLAPFLSLLLLISGSNDGWATPFHQQNVTYRQFEEIVRAAVARQPDLQKLWKDGPVLSTTFGGGAFRGLLIWLNRQLDHHSVEQVNRLPVPTITELLLQKDADKDLVAGSGYGWYLKQNYKGWDVLDEPFMRDSIAAGGAGLDRASASPWLIRDPLEGLRDLYLGNLAFKARKPGALKGNTTLALALRYLRFVKEFESLASPDLQARDVIRQGLATDKIPACLSGDPKDSESTRYWIKKALKKYLNAYPGSPAQALVRLKDYGLLPILGQKNYPLFGVDGIRLASLTPILVQSGFTVDDLVSVGRMLVWTDVKGLIAYQNSVLPLARSEQEISKVLNGLSESKSPQYEAAIQELARSFRAPKSPVSAVIPFEAKAEGACAKYRQIAELAKPRALTLEDWYKDAKGDYWVRSRDPNMFENMRTREFARHPTEFKGDGGDPGDWFAAENTHWFRVREGEDWYASPAHGGFRRR